jgi:hypothetical protein
MSISGPECRAASRPRQGWANTACKAASNNVCPMFVATGIWGYVKVCSRIEAYALKYWSDLFLGNAAVLALCCERRNVSSPRSLARLLEAQSKREVMATEHPRKVLPNYLMPCVFCIEKRR